MPFIGNATTNDLWAALSKQSGKDVNSFMVCDQIPPFLIAELRMGRIFGSARLAFRSSLSPKNPVRSVYAKLAFCPLGMSDLKKTQRRGGFL